MKKNKLSKNTYLNHNEITLNNRIKNTKKEYGVFFTPEWLVNFMIKLITKNKKKNDDEITILEPGCGLAQFLIGIKKNKPLLFKRAKLFGVEINKEIVDFIDTIGIDNKINLVFQDYLLWETNSLFDIIIGNPPYGIPGNSYHYPIKITSETKTQYKKLYQTWYGKYNLYGAFIEKSVKLLSDEGQLIFIVPATFMILDEFKKLRQFLSKKGITQIIYMGPDVFKPEADVASVVLNFRKSIEKPFRLELLEYSKNGKIIKVKQSKSWDGEIIIFETEYTKKMKNLCSYQLGDVYDIRISPRTPEIKVKYKDYIVQENFTKKNEYLPILNSRNLKSSGITYQGLAGYWIKRENVKKLRKFFLKPHSVVGLGFRGKGRVVAAYDEKGYPWMGDVYHLLKKTIISRDNGDLDDFEVATYLNSDYTERYIKETYRNITYHLNITQLKSIPLPTKKELRQFREYDKKT